MAALPLHLFLGCIVCILNQLLEQVFSTMAALPLEPATFVAKAATKHRRHDTAGGFVVEPI